ncbi:MAG: T9SS type A sorting domain-containing protein, partial [Bacteroidetes bacterium]|nr:T9SS type A sorting domain-containing protein [Bacteroidota bacterium]
DKLYLTVQSYNKKDIGIAVTAMILSPNGAINVRERLIINEGENNFELNVGHLKSGMYFVKILSGAEQILSEKVIKW